MYDVIAAGADPTGSTSAKILADKGLHVLMVEGHKLPHYKSCSGVLIHKAEKWLMPHIWPGCSVIYRQGWVLFADENTSFLHSIGQDISSGMERDHCAALAIANHFDSLDMIYADYQRGTQQLKAYMERQRNFVGRMAGYSPK